MNSLKSNSKEYNEFWSFLRKYQALLKRRPPPSLSTTSAQLNNQYSAKFNLPLKYDKRWRLNFLLKLNRSHLTTYDASGLIRTYISLYLFK
jgi:hypothetical protein